MKKPGMMNDLKQRLTSEVDYEAWQRLNDDAQEQGWIEPWVHKSNNTIIMAAIGDDRPDLLIPVALSMVPEGWGFGIGRGRIISEGRGFLTDGERSFDRSAQCPAAALALAVIEARRAEQ